MRTKIDEAILEKAVTLVREGGVIHIYGGTMSKKPLLGAYLHNLRLKEQEKEINLEGKRDVL